jgi:hypothetical protein
VKKGGGRKKERRKKEKEGRGTLGGPITPKEQELLSRAMSEGTTRGGVTQST